MSEVEREATDLDSKVGPGYSKVRSEAMVLHKDQRIKFISEKADELLFSDLAQESCTVRIGELKSSWIKHKKDSALFFQSKDYKTLQTERESIRKEKTHIELDLRAYFDHHSHGTSRSESAKIDHKALKLARVKRWSCIRISVSSFPRRRTSCRLLTLLRSPVQCASAS